MIYTIIGTISLAMTTTVFLWHVVEPSLFRRLVRQRFTHADVLPHKINALPTRATLSKWLKRKRLTRSDGERYADALDAIGRELRLGSSLHAAVIAAVERCAIAEWSWLAAASREGHMLSDVISQLTEHDNTVQMPTATSTFALQAIAVAAAGGDSVHAVETAARTLRVTAALVAESHTAVAHTKTSIAVLTWVPMVLASWLLLRDTAVRTFFSSTAGVVCLLIGLLLQWTGRRWVARLTRAATRVDSDLPDFVDVVSVHLRSGQPPALAFMNASGHARGVIGTAAQQVAHDVQHGARFIDALSTARNAFGLPAQPLIDALLDTERDGLSPRELFERLAFDAHAQRRRDADARIRALPVRLTLPLVGCILPAYVLLAVLPLLASQFSSVTVDLP